MNATEAFVAFFDSLKRWGLEYLGLYYGVYRATVSSIEEGDQGRIAVIVPATGSTTIPLANLAYPKFAFAGAGYGVVMLPQEGDTVWVEFEGGRIDRPLWTGGWFGTDEMPEAFKGKYGKAWGWTTPTGHSIVFDEDTQRVMISHKNADDGESFMALTDDGEVIIQTRTGETLYLKEKACTLLDSNKNVVAMDEEGVKIFDSKGNMVFLAGSDGLIVVAAGDLALKAKGVVNVEAGTVNVQGNAEPMVLGMQLTTWLSTHTHTATSLGAPTSPPVVPPSGITSTKAYLG